MRASALLALVSLVLLIPPRFRENEKLLAAACAAVFLSLWIDKGVGLIVGGFVPSPLGAVTRYAPTLPEISISIGVWALGFLILTLLYKVAIAVRGEAAGGAH
jgi:molybdopterin-containing oxidoreductase family membrane subunit